MSPTTLQLVATFLQGVAAFSIAGGLIWSAFQFRHLRRASHVANFQKLVHMQLELRRMRVEDPTLAAVYQDDIRNTATPEEVRQYFFNLMQLSLFEIAWYAHRHGQLADDYWASWCRRMRIIFAEKSFRAMMLSPGMKILHDDFEALVRKMMAESVPLDPA